ncbi:hypothetical protein M747DRAFT_349041 [Aspergillus niger ATCC 13496]|uniref:Uncharacterized protein n=3 Tax=Aspergillus niger TaxID=5061 RepID=A2R0W6_ASPNC|nr:hypothetical protein An12g10080 [Aspergillus niger]RDH21976.1 hypothetical protein M747DRAFT_349041 [Aspergillus niger ATCC 13496]CAL00908.1 hypothetical protein An12g10080 [Aspergillus niger]
MAWLVLQGGENEYNRAMRGNYSRLGAFRIIEEFLVPHSTVTIEETAQALHDLLPPPDDPAFPGGADLFGNLILELSQQIEYDNAAQDRFVRVIQRLQESDRVKKHIPRRAGAGGFGRYETMPQMALSLVHYSAPQMDRDRNEEHFLNVRAFIARLCRVGVLQAQAWLVNEMRAALEDTLPDDMDMVSIQGAAIIILFAGEWLFEEVARAPKLDEIHDNDMWRTGTYYTGPRYGFTRWRHWQRLLMWVQRTVPLDQEARRLMFNAAWYMYGIARCLPSY